MEFDRKDDVGFIRWAYAVKKRDAFTCQICGLRGVELNAHHINSWDAFPEERYDLNNGITLDENYHRQFHLLYGYGNNTFAQFDEYRKACEIMQNQIRKNIMVETAVEEIKKKLKVDLDGYQDSNPG